MSDSAASKEVAVESNGMPEMAMGDVEMGDKGITTTAAPLLRELKSRHLQMIAIGKNAPVL
jgi:amino acid permease